MVKEMLKKKCVTQDIQKNPDSFKNILLPVFEWYGCKISFEYQAGANKLDRFNKKSIRIPTDI
jgi:hypothetical protein